VHVTTTKDSELVRSFEAAGAQIFITDYSTVESLKQALARVDVVVSLIGPGPETKESKSVVVEALKVAGTKVYFPSEFGTNHYTRMKNYDADRYVVKKAHFRESVQAGIKTVRIFSGLFLEYSLDFWFGLDNEPEDWPFVGTGNDPVALTALDDLGSFTLAAAMLALKVYLYHDLRLVLVDEQYFNSNLKYKS